jgi:hypothetical protein
MKLKLIDENTCRESPPSFGFINIQKLKKAQAKLTLKQVIEWGEETCIGLNGEPLKRFDCSHCIAELKKLAEEK